MALDQRIEIHSDINLMDPGSGNSRLINLDALAAAVNNILTQPPYQRLWDPDGLELERTLFQLADDEQALILKTYIARQFAKDPRMELDFSRTNIFVLQDDPHQFFVDLYILAPQINANERVRITGTYKLVS